MHLLHHAAARHGEVARQIRLDPLREVRRQRLLTPLRDGDSLRELAEKGAIECACVRFT